MIDSYKDLTLKKFMEIRELDMDVPEIDLQVSLIAILSDQTEDEILSLPLSEYSARAAKTRFLMEQPKPQSRPPKSIKLNGREYHIVRNARELTAGQYIDYLSYIENPEKMEANLPLVMSVFLIPKDGAYGDNIETVIKDCEDIPIEVVFCLSRFFFRKSKSLIEATLTYLDWTIRRTIRKEKNPETAKNLMEARTRIRSLLSSVRDGDEYAL